MRTTGSTRSSRRQWITEHCGNLPGEQNLGKHSTQNTRSFHARPDHSQRDRKDSKFPVREEASKWDEKLQKLLLHHSEEDNAENIRAYFPATMAVTKCHEDVQQGDGNGAVLHYVATYSTKFSSCLAIYAVRVFVFVYPKLFQNTSLKVRPVLLFLRHAHQLKAPWNQTG